MNSADAANFLVSMPKATDVFQCIQMIQSSYLEYRQIAEDEQTKRSKIDSWEKTTLASIESQRTILLTFLDRSFDERKEIFEGLFNAADQSMLSGDNDRLALILSEITALAKSNPFKEIQNLSDVQAALANPEHEWKF